MTEVESTTTLWSIIFGKEPKAVDWDSEEGWQLPTFRQPERIKIRVIERREKRNPGFNSNLNRKPATN